MTFALVFGAQTAALGQELYVTNATGTGATLVRDINVGGGDGVDSFFFPFGASLGSRVVFGGRNAGAGSEPWVTDGTADGTVRLADLNPGSADSDPTFFTAVGGRVFFDAIGPTTGDEPYVTDGTPGGTRLVLDIFTGTGDSLMSEPITFNGQLLFAAIDPSRGEELFISDGSAAGTRLVADIDPGPLDSLLELDQGGVLNDRVLFSADDGVFGQELWFTDGTTTSLVADINPLGDSSPDELTLFNGRVYFDADDGLVGEELWRSDGTSGGTQLVADINPLGDSSPDDLLALGSRLIFSAIGPAGRELYASDGTAAGTALVLDIDPGPAGGIFDANFTLVGDGSRAVFAANNAAAGIELWVTDGTAEGTQLLADINPGGGDSLPTEPDFLRVGALTYFTARNPLNGRELWVTDGTAAGTRLVADIAANAADSNPVLLGALDINGPPANLTLSGSTVQENAANGTVVGTLAATDPDGNPLTFALSDNAGGRFSLSGASVVVNGTIDFEATPTLTIAATATDPGGLSTSQSFTIGVSDVSEAPAPFSLSASAVTENAAVGTTVGTFAPTDPNGSPLTFTLSDSAGGLFRIEGTSLVVNGAIDFEAGPSRSVTVQARDAAGGVVSLTFTIAVGDLNDATPGNDRLTGTDGADTIDALAGNDRVAGLRGNDTLIGNLGRDRLLGDQGRDEIDGGGGRDRLTGGGGRDDFVFTGRFGRDIVTDFETAKDEIDLTGRGLDFGDLDLSTRGGDALIRVQGGGRIVLRDVAAGELDADMFLF